jgi:hypothetical protein
MTDPNPSGPPTGPARPRNPGLGVNWIDRRRHKIAEEIARNRRGDFRVPTWVLTAALVGIVLAWAALIIFT